ncbi:MAG TPA: hypothetical protein VER79_04835, partial [Candidatus Limnocylindrales bacterium]|nr:hypothetical protein [Candidatus Limnocylindrales bacterium]
SVALGRYQNATRALLFLRDVTSDPGNAGANPAFAEAPAFTLDGLEDGAYRLELWNTLTGEFTVSEVEVAGGEVTLSLPPFQRALAVKVIPAEGSDS